MTQNLAGLPAEAKALVWLDAIADPVFVRNTSGRWLFANAALCRLLNCEAATLLRGAEGDAGASAVLSQAPIRPVLEHQRASAEMTVEDIRGQRYRVKVHSCLLWLPETDPLIMSTLRSIEQRPSETDNPAGQRQQLLGAIATHLTRSPSPNDVLSMVLRELQAFFQAECVVFIGLDVATQDLHVEVTAGQSLPLQINQPRLAAWAAQVQAWRGDDTAAQAIATTVAVDFGLERGARSDGYRGVPVICGSTFYGVLGIGDTAARQWQNWELQTLGDVADRTGSALEQACVYRRIRQLNSALEQQIDQRSEELHKALEFEATLKRITDRVRDSLDEKQIMLTAVQEVTQALGVKGSNTALYDLEQGTSQIYYEYNQSLPSYQGRVAQMEAFPEVYNQLLQGQYFQFCSKEPNPVRGHVAMLACPILDDRGVLGDLWLINDKDYGFSELEIRLVQQVANQCAIALRQARLYQAAQTQVEQLEHLNRLKDDFLSTVSHELRTPVTSIRVALQLLGMTLNQEFDLNAELQKEKTQQSRIARYYQILQEECEREIGLINDLLDLQRLDVGNHPVELEPVVLQTWLPMLVNGFVARAKSRDQQLLVAIPEELPDFSTDIASLERVMAELLNNACKYTPPAGQIHLDVAATADGQRIQFHLANTGVEIPEAEISRIFDKFYRVPSADPWKQGGTGLGLALVQKLVSYLGGTITVASADGRTCFTVELPSQLEFLSKAP